MVQKNLYNLTPNKNRVDPAKISHIFVKIYTPSREKFQFAHSSQTYVNPARNASLVFFMSNSCPFLSDSAICLLCIYFVNILIIWQSKGFFNWFMIFELLRLSIIRRWRFNRDHSWRFCRPRFVFLVVDMYTPSMF